MEGREGRADNDDGEAGGDYKIYWDDTNSALIMRVKVASCYQNIACQVCIRGESQSQSVMRVGWGFGDCFSLSSPAN